MHRFLFPGIDPPADLFSPAQGAPIKIYFHRAVMGRFNFKPMPARILFAAAMPARAGRSPGAQNIGDNDLFAAPDKLLG